MTKTRATAGAILLGIAGVAGYLVLADDVRDLTHRQRAELVSATVVSSLGYYWETDSIPDAPDAEHRGCARIAVRMACTDIHKAKPSHACVDGSMTAVWFEVSLTKEYAELPIPDDRYRKRAKPVLSSYRRIPCAQASNPSKAIHPVGWADLPDGARCLYGMVRRDVSASSDGSKWKTWPTPHACCGPRCQCDDPPCAVCSRYGGECRERWCETRPEMCL